MGTPGVDSPHTLFLFSTPLTAGETTNIAHLPTGCVDGAAQIAFTRIKGRNHVFLTDLNIQKP